MLVINRTWADVDFDAQTIEANKWCVMHALCPRRKSVHFGADAF